MIINTCKSMFTGENLRSLSKKEIFHLIKNNKTIYMDIQPCKDENCKIKCTKKKPRIA